MDALSAIRNRRSTRKFAKKPIPREQLEAVIDAGRLAPTARNEQPWEFVVITDTKRLGELADLTDHGKFIVDAAACVAVFCKHGKYYLEDGCAATTNILVAAAALGIGSCWVAGDKKAYCQTAAALLGVPPEYNLIALIALGYPQADSKAPFKRDLAKVLHWEKF
jgi:nitroreductase